MNLHKWIEDNLTEEAAEVATALLKKHSLPTAVTLFLRDRISRYGLDTVRAEWFENKDQIPPVIRKEVEKIL